MAAPIRRDLVKLLRRPGYALHPDGLCRAGVLALHVHDAVSRQSGALGKFATGFAARIAGADKEGVALFERFGDHTFTLAQLVDDLRDACAPGRDSDLAQRKATLPVVFYGQEFDSPAPVDGILSRDICNSYESSVAPLYVAILAQAYIMRADEDLTFLARHGDAVGGFVRFFESVDSDAGKTLSAARSRLVA